MNTIIPNKLKKGDKVVLITPAGAAKPGQVDNITKSLKEMGLNVCMGKYLNENIGYLAGTDEQKLNDIHEAFKDDSIKAIFCVRGGYGCMRLLDKLDYDLISKNPKILVGMSDITSLSAAILKNTGLITYSGPMEWHFSRDESDFCSNNLKSILFDAGTKIELEADTILNTGFAKGCLIGGNLEILQSLISTDYDYEYEDNILFFESVGCFRYVIDRILHQFKHSKKFNKVKAIIIGQNSYRQNDPFVYSFEQIVEGITKDLDIPILIGAKFGHLNHHLTLPIGQQVELNVTDNDQVLKLI